MNTEVTQCSVSILADVLCSNKYLEELDISHNTISDSDVRYLALATNNSVLKRIDQAESDVSDEGATYLAEMLATNADLLQLSLNGNRIGNYGMNLLANVLKQSNTHLELLNLRVNTDIGDEGIDSLVDMMEHNRSLKKTRSAS
jgi:Ran GTPase-activating protein (RanGAP) involved in mRNA processing and transport